MGETGGDWHRSRAGEPGPPPPPPWSAAGDPSPQGPPPPPWPPTEAPPARFPWSPPDRPPPPDDSPTDPLPRRAWSAFRRWPAWGQATAWVAVAFLVLGAVGASADDDDAVSVGPEASTTEQPADPTTTAIPTTQATTTTAPTTTSTVPPTTTTVAPPTTQAPPPPPTAPPPPAVPAPTIAPQPLAGCHPSYTPCVPYAPDVDCLGGSGNGPAYTGPVQVVGPDDYDLDRDSDGLGCET
jgi:hypothetical protein